MIFLFPLAFSIVATAYFVFVGESVPGKIITVIIVALSVLFQFVPQLHVHFLIPFFMQLLVCIAFAIHLALR